MKKLDLRWRLHRWLNAAPYGRDVTIVRLSVAGIVISALAVVVEVWHAEYAYAVAFCSSVTAWLVVLVRENSRTEPLTGMYATRRGVAWKTID